ncbi:hypothetical protein V6N13_013033 [Hibiscus sabdariffa]|uniref:Fiber Fb32-like protein n=1 Tax=Hibiscus sabdariffa TaxID=183260 RepID=A0ABR2SHL4_9ROSI
MDFKFKGIGWVGGIYQKFETLCHEMDNIVNQDTVKYVENQAPSVGKSTKRFYSDVVFPLKHEGQGVALERSTTIDTSVESKAAIQEDYINTVCNLSHVEPVAVDTIEKQLDHASNELSPLVQLSIPTSVDALDGAGSGIISQQTTAVMKTSSSVVSIEENSIREKASVSDVSELISPREEESFGDSLTNNKFIDCSEKISSGTVGEAPLTMLVHDMESQSPKKETGISDNNTVDVVSRQLECAFGELCRVDQPGNPNSVDSHLRKQYITSEEAAEVLNDTEPEVNLEEYSTMVQTNVSYATSAVDDQNRRKIKYEGAGVSECVSDASGDATSSKMDSSVICCEKDRAEVGVDVAELVSHNAHSSSMLTSLLSNEKELMVATSISSSNYLSMVSVGNDTYRTVNSSKSLTGTSGNKNLHFGGVSAQLQVSSSSNIGHVDDSIDDINISSMDTVDLYDEVKLEDSCVIPDSVTLHAVSRRINKNKSYRKRIQEALTSRKRLVKEYEQLAIWFGDADMGSGHDHFQTLQPSSSTTLEPKNTRTEPVCDSDWEIL